MKASSDKNWKIEYEKLAAELLTLKSIDQFRDLQWRIADERVQHAARN